MSAENEKNEQQNKANFIPWRDSKLTRILKDSLSQSKDKLTIKVESVNFVIIQSIIKQNKSK